MKSLVQSLEWGDTQQGTDRVDGGQNDDRKWIYFWLDYLKQIFLLPVPT